MLSSQVAGVHGAILSLADLGVLFVQLQTRLQSGSGALVVKDANRGRASARNTHDDDEDLDSDFEPDSGDEVQAGLHTDATATVRPLTAAEGAARLVQMTVQHDQLLGFVIAGLRTAARGASGEEGEGEKSNAGQAGEASWGVLAEVLAWGLRA